MSDANTAAGERPAVTLVEVGPRDGLQNEPVMVPAADKIRLIDMLTAAGFRRIEATSFVSPRWVPQMGDAAEVMAGIERGPGVAYAALTPNMKGFEAARAAGVDEVSVFAAASETFSRKNINCTIAESLERFAPMMEGAAAAAMPVRGYISCVTDCPYEGSVAPEAVARLAADLDRMGCHEISLGDTIGHGTPETVEVMLEAVTRAVPVERLAGHFHDTNGRALDNIAIALGRGVRVFDSAVAGLGGCPFAPGAAGNVDTSKVVTMLNAGGYEFGLDRTALAEAARFAAGLRSHDSQAAAS